MSFHKHWCWTVINPSQDVIMYTDIDEMALCWQLHIMQHVQLPAENRTTCFFWRTRQILSLEHQNLSQWVSLGLCDISIYLDLFFFLELSLTNQTWVQVPVYLSSHCIIIHGHFLCLCMGRFKRGSNFFASLVQFLQNRSWKGGRELFWLGNRI